MRIATWNVNSVRARLPRLLDWLARAQPDVVALQEIKCVDEQFPREPLEEAGYCCAVLGQKTYNGVAILSKKRIEDVQLGMESERFGAESRVISAAIEDVLLVNVYVINGQMVGAPRYHDKLAWLGDLAQWLPRRFDVAREKVVVAGDFNVTFDDRDIYDPEAWREKILCSTPEREALQQVMACGLSDGFRKLHADPGHYTWWDMRVRGFQRGMGLRIDHALLSAPAHEALSSASIDLEARGGEKPSDHAPLVFEV